MHTPISRSVWSRFYGLLCILLLFPLQCLADDLNVLLVLSGSATPYQTFTTSFRQHMPAHIHVSVLEHAEAFSGAEQQADLIVTVGVKAGEWVVSRTTRPVLAAMLPSYEYANLLAGYPSTKQFSAIFVDQPWSRQVNLLRAALPDHKQIGLLHSPETPLDLKGLKELLARYGATLIEKSADSSDTLFNSLNSVLMHSDVLLAVPDNKIYNSNNIRNILLSSYRDRIPMVGLSQAYVRAGALCAVFSTPENLAVQASAETVSFAQTGQLPKAQFPKLYNVAVNREVALMLGIHLKSPEQLKSLLEQAEE